MAAGGNSSEQDGAPEFQQEAVDISGISIPPEEVRNLIEPEYRQARMALYAGLAIVLLGVAVVLLRVSGLVSWTINIANVNSTLANASPGIVLIVVGAIVILANRPSIKIAGAPPKP